MKSINNENDINRNNKDVYDIISELSNFRNGVDIVFSDNEVAYVQKINDDIVLCKHKPRYIFENEDELNKIIHTTSLNKYDFIELKSLIKLPSPCGENAEKYLNLMKIYDKHDVYTIDEKMQVVSCKGYINRDNVMHVKFENKCDIPRWFSFYKHEVVEVQLENIKRWNDILNFEITKINKL